MNSVNEVVLQGRAGHAPKGGMAGNTHFANLSVATKDDRSNETDWHQVSAYGSVAKALLATVKKGAEVEIRGRLKHREYTDKQGINRRVTEILCISFSLVVRDGSVPGEEAKEEKVSLAPLPAAISRESRSVKSGELSEGQFANVGEAMGEMSNTSRHLDNVLGNLINSKIMIDEALFNHVKSGLDEIHVHLQKLVLAHLDATERRV